MNFSGVCAPMIDTIKGGRKCKFIWNSEVDKSYEYLKRRVAEQPIFALPDFHEVFIVECDASNNAIGGVLSQEGRLIALFSEKINEAKQNYSTYDLKMHALA